MAEGGRSQAEPEGELLFGGTGGRARGSVATGQCRTCTVENVSELNELRFPEPFMSVAGLMVLAVLEGEWGVETGGKHFPQRRYGVSLAHVRRAH